MEISAKSNKTSFKYLKYVIDNLLKCLSETQGATVTLMHQSIPAVPIPQGDRGDGQPGNRGLGISVPRATPKHLTHMFSMDEFIGKDAVFVKDWLVRQGLEKLVDVLKICFLIHIYLFITCNHINISDHGELYFGYHKTITYVNTA